MDILLEQELEKTNIKNDFNKDGTAELFLIFILHLYHIKLLEKRLIPQADIIKQISKMIINKKNPQPLKAYNNLLSIDLNEELRFWFINEIGLYRTEDPGWNNLIINKLKKELDLKLQELGLDIL